jgi:hypothetical protein
MTTFSVAAEQLPTVLDVAKTRAARGAMQREILVAAEHAPV